MKSIFISIEFLLTFSDSVPCVVSCPQTSFLVHPYCWNITWQIPVIMSFAVPDRPQEIRMEAAYFLQQLFQSRSGVICIDIV